MNIKFEVKHKNRTNSPHRFDCGQFDRCGKKKNKTVLVDHLRFYNEKKNNVTSHGNQSLKHEVSKIYREKTRYETFFLIKKDCL